MRAVISVSLTPSLVDFDEASYHMERPVYQETEGGFHKWQKRLGPSV